MTNENKSLPSDVIHLNERNFLAALPKKEAKWQWREKHRELIKNDETYLRKAIFVIYTGLAVTAVSAIAGGAIPLFSKAAKSWPMRILTAVFSAIGAAVVSGGLSVFLGYRYLQKKALALQEMESRLEREERLVQPELAVLESCQHQKEKLQPIAATTLSEPNISAKPFAAAITSPAQSHTSQIAQEPKAASPIPTL